MKSKLLGCVALLAVASCGGRDFDGSHSGPGQGNYFADGHVVKLEQPSETVDVKKEGAVYVVTVRGCILRGTKKGDGLVDMPDQPCTIDVPSVGPVKLTMNGHMTSVTKAPLHKIIRANINLHGEEPSGGAMPARRLDYMIEPTYIENAE